MKKNKVKWYKKVIDKYYHLYGFMYQHLYLNTVEVMDEKSSCLDVHLWDEKKKEIGPWMFMIQNYNAFKDMDFVPYYSYLKDNKMIETWDGVKASYTPFYDDWSYEVPMFTLPKFTCITKDDIERCMRYFVREKLDIFCIWNVSFGTDKQDWNQHTFNWEK